MAQRANKRQLTTEPSAAEIQEQMALTRLALAAKLEKLKGRLLGEPVSSNKGDIKIMPSTRTRSQAKAPRTGKRSNASSSKKKSTPSLASAKASSRKKSGTKKSALARVASRSGVTKAAKSVKSSGFVKKAEKVMGRVLAGAASGAVSGALEAVLPAGNSSKVQGRKQR
jgi:hypothetical protein